MKISVLLILFALFSTTIFAQTNAGSGLTLSGSYTADNLTNIRGGLKSGYNYLGVANIYLGFSTEKAGLWKNGEFYVHGASTHGGEPTANLVGDYQTASNIEAGDHTYLQQLWFKQKVKSFEFTLGLQDYNVDFANTETGANFINSSFGIMSSISGNFNVPIFPLTGLGLTTKWQATPNVEVKAAIFDGKINDFEENPYNIKWNLNRGEGYFGAGELVYSSAENARPGISAKLGFYYHNHFNSENIAHATGYNWGTYLISDQVWYANEESGKQVSSFVQLGLSPEKANPTRLYYGAGIYTKGIFAFRETDEVGLAFAHACTGSSYGSGETSIELTYKLVLGDMLSVQPDLQYIINPSGTESKLDNALVGILRVSLAF
jgi:porin